MSVWDGIEHYLILEEKPRQITLHGQVVTVRHKLLVDLPATMKPVDRARFLDREPSAINITDYRSSKT